MNAKRTVGFIGGGRAARILLGGFRNAGAEFAGVVVSEPETAAREKLRTVCPEASFGGIEEAASQDLVFLAVHPPVAAEAAGAARAALRSEAFLVSLAPKITLARLGELLGGFERMARMIPNAPSLIGEGWNPIAFHPAAPEREKASLRELLAGLGECPETEEGRLEAYAMLTGMGPTYFWFQFRVLAELAEKFGLDPEKAAPALERTACGAAKLFFSAGLSPEEVADLVPVKPLAPDEPAIAEAYRKRLPALFEKIRPA